MKATTAMHDDDPWLHPWLALLAQEAGGRPILELGCGHGLDTAVLVQLGFAVVAIDRDADAVADAQRRMPQVQFVCQDLLDPWPVAAPCGGVLASLSLHYFPWAQTAMLAGRIHTLLRAGGLLLARLNSSTDHHFGASGHAQIEPGLFSVDGRPKRFFDRAAVERLFDAQHWATLSLHERTIGRYGQPKVVWELVAEAR